jgi:hypothetical protein
MASRKIETELMYLGSIPYYDAVYDIEWAIEFQMTRDADITLCQIYRQTRRQHRTSQILLRPDGLGMARRRPDEKPSAEGLRAAFRRALPVERGYTRAQVWKEYLRYEQSLVYRMMADYNANKEARKCQD